jgi:hypothetical protein
MRRGIWRPNDFNEISFGIHADRYFLNNPTYATPTWNGGAELYILASHQQPWSDRDAGALDPGCMEVHAGLEAHARRSA